MAFGKNGDGGHTLRREFLRCELQNSGTSGGGSALSQIAQEGFIIQVDKAATG
jgi:hypothetical protein